MAIRNRPRAMLIGMIAGLFLLAFVCCSGFIVLGTMVLDESESSKGRQTTPDTNDSSESKSTDPADLSEQEKMKRNQDSGRSVDF